MKTKRLIGLALAALLCTAAFSGCNDNAAQSSSEGAGSSAAGTETSTPQENSGKFTALGVCPVSFSDWRICRLS